MASTKAALKAAKAALDAENYDEAISQAKVVVESDPENYFANVFLGRAYDKQGKTSEAIQAYNSATKARPNDPQAWLGLRELYSGKGHTYVDQYIDVGIKLAGLFGNTDKHKCVTAIEKALTFARKNGTKEQQIKALEAQTPQSPVYEFIEGSVPHPAHTYIRIAEATEEMESERINMEIGERRTRLGARIGTVTTEVKREVYGQSKLEDVYQEIINWTNDDEIRRRYEEKLLQRAYDMLVALPMNEEKKAKREQVMEQAHGMVIIKHPFALAWEIELEWKDIESVNELDANVLREFVAFFPEKGLAKVIKGYLCSEISPFPFKLPQPDGSKKEEASGEDKDGESQDDEDIPLTSEDCLLLMTKDGLDDAKESMLAHKLMGEYYLYLEEYEPAVEVCRQGFKLFTVESSKSGLQFRKNRDFLNSILATALVHYQAPKNHPEAKAIFEEILKRRATFTPALIGIGLILEEEEEFAEAIDFLSRAYERDQQNVRVGAEAAWCKALNGDYATGLKELEESYARMDPKDARMKDLRAQTLYRIGRCLWELDPSRAARKDRKGAYSKFLAAIKTNINFAPAYSSLGFFYADYAKDRKRARQCFQKAFELSGSEVEAAERLARDFADDGDWDIVETIAQRVIDSGRVRPAPGSKKKGISWPYSALGIVQMNRQDYSKSIVSFLAALRISPDDYNSYVGLGESYHNSGRYNSAARTFKYAEESDDAVKLKRPAENWFTKYMLANVNREIGEFDEAIQGYEGVLKARPNEFGVSIALLQTLVERAWRHIETGFYGKAADGALQAIDTALSISEYKAEAFNLWKAVADAFSIFTWVQSRIQDMPFEKAQKLLMKEIDVKEYDLIVEADGIGQDRLQQLLDGEDSPKSRLYRCLEATILAHKRAIHACAHDMHAQAVSWYNLGWAEYRAHVCVGQVEGEEDQPKNKTFLKAAVRCFKRAIELEASNSEFWNALGVVTSQLNPKVAQHSFVRSLNLNERSVRTWTNIATLYLLQNDLELAHQAFARAQSTDPEYAHAWIGEGIIALLWGDAKEALSHFTHAFEISDSSSIVVKRQYPTSLFDHLLSSPIASNDIKNLIQPIFALQQLKSQLAIDLPGSHLAALYLERVGNHDAASSALVEICASAEADYEVSESPSSLARYAQATTDLARNQLATHTYDEAANSAEMALDLLSDPASCGMSLQMLERTRLSARLTVGLARYYLNDMDASINAFRAALEDSNSNPDVVCLLAQVLWAKGGVEERNVARDQLFDCVEQHPDHVDAVVLMGAIAAIDEDMDVMDAVRGDLESLRASGKLNSRLAGRVGQVLDAIAAISSASATGEPSDTAVLKEVETSIMLAPSKSHGWSQLAELQPEEPFPAEMAVKAAERDVPPRGPLEAEELSAAFSGTGRVVDAQKAIALAPWRKEAWMAFVETITEA